MELKLIWKDGIAYCGRVKIGSVWFDGTRPSGDENCISATSYMPGIKDFLGRFKTTEEAKIKIDKVFAHWVTMLTDEV